DQGLLRGAEAARRARPRSLPPEAGSPPGSPGGLGPDVEHVPQSPRPGVRDPEVRGRPGEAERLRAATAVHRHPEGRADPATFPLAGAALVVPPGYVSRADEHPGGRVPGAGGTRRSVRGAQALRVRRSCEGTCEYWSPDTGVTSAWRWFRPCGR